MASRRRIVWRTPQWAYERFRSLLGEMDGVAPDSDLAAAIEDEIRSLPNYPRIYDPERDEIEPQVSTVR